MTTSTPRPVTLILRVANLERAVHFYRDILGIPLEPGFNTPEDDAWYGGRHAEFSWREGGYFHFALFPAQRAKKRSPLAVEIGLTVADVNEVHERVRAASGEILHDPRPEPWGTTARYLDPDGNVVSVTSR